MKLSVLLKG